MRDQSLPPASSPAGLARLRAAAIGGLLLLIALGSGATDAGPDAGGLQPAGPALLRAALILGVLVEGLVITLVVWALWPDGERRGAPRARSNWLAMTLATFLQMGSGLLLLYYLRQRRLNGGPAIDGALLGPVKAPPVLTPASLPAGGTLLTAAIVVTVLVLVAFRWRHALGWGRRARRAVAAGEVGEVGEAVQRALDDLEWDPDPRRAVISAYGRMTDAIGAGGLVRQPQDTAHEFLVRVLARLAVPEEPVRRLTDLFQLARFGPHPIDPDMRAEAIAALLAIRSALTPSGPGATAPALLRGPGTP